MVAFLQILRVFNKNNCKNAKHILMRWNKGNMEFYKINFAWFVSFKNFYKNQHSSLDSANNQVLYNNQNKGRQRNKEKKKNKKSSETVLATTAKAAYIKL